jgi:hypothetical protein
MFSLWIEGASCRSDVENEGRELAVVCSSAGVDVKDGTTEAEGNGGDGVGVVGTADGVYK